MEENDHAGTTENHFSHADYDWMGILDSCIGPDHHVGQRSYSFDFSAVHGSGRSHVDLQALANDAEHEVGDGKVSASEVKTDPFRATNEGDKSRDTSTHADSQTPEVQAVTKAAESEDHTGVAQAQAQAPQNYYAPAPSPATSTHVAKPLADVSMEQSKSAKPPPDDEEAKKNSRVERKRHREKQRRLDTNSQFAALSEIIREIETEDFVEEASGLVSTATGTQSAGGTPAAAAVAATAGQADSNPDDPQITSKKFKTDFSSTSTSKTVSSNRVDLIARTCSVITQLRQIRRSRREELRDARRQNFEMRKEIEELRRAVAHYKAVGMGPAKPQEKVSTIRTILRSRDTTPTNLINFVLFPLIQVMMMVPMMVPQDAVNTLATGYPAAHPIGGNFVTPWMHMGQPHSMASMHPSQTHHFPPGMLGASGTTGHAPSAAAPSSQMATAPFAASYPQYPNPMQFGGAIQGHSSSIQNSQNASQHPHSSGEHATQPSSFPDTNSENVTSTSAPPGAANDASGAPPNHQPPTFAHAPSPAMSNPVPMHMQAHPYGMAPGHHTPTMAIHPHMAQHVVPTSVPYGMHPHMQNQAPAPANPSVDTTAKPPGARTSSPPQGGGGNLAHCA